MDNKNNGEKTMKATINGTFVVLGLLSNIAWGATPCPYPLMKDCGLPTDVKNCLNPTPTAPCVANRMGKYPLVDAGSKIPIEGCYNDKFVRKYNLSTDQTCTKDSTVTAGLLNKDAPIRVELYYHTSCSGDRPTCLNGAQVVVNPSVKNDSPVGAVKMNLSNNTLQPIALKASAADNASKEFCTALYGNGYAFNTTTQKCEISVEVQCQLLGMRYDPVNNKCDPLCAAQYCTTDVTEQVCAGYTITNSAQNCICKGTSTTFDSNGARCDDCSGKATSLPVNIGRSDLVGYWRLNGNLNSEIGGNPLRDGALSDGAGGTQLQFTKFNNTPLRPIRWANSDPLFGNAAIFDGRSFAWVGNNLGTKYDGTALAMPTGNASRTLMGWAYTEDRTGWVTATDLPTACSNYRGLKRNGMIFKHGKDWNGSTWAMETGVNGNNAACNSLTVYNWDSASNKFGGVTATSDTTWGKIPSAGWWHWAITWSGTSAKIYINGVKVKEEPSGGNVLNTPSSVLSYGGQDTGNNTALGLQQVWENGSLSKFFVGRMRELMVFKSEVSGTDILDIYNKSKAGFCDNVPTDSGSRDLAVVIANELPRAAGQQFQVDLSTKARYTYTLTGLSGQLTTSIKHSDGTSTWQIPQPNAVKLQVKVRSIAGSVSSGYIRIYNNGYSKQKAFAAVNSTTEQTVDFDDVTLSGLDRVLIVHVSTASIPDVPRGSARIFFAPGAAFDAGSTCRISNAQFSLSSITTDGDPVTNATFSSNTFDGTKNYGDAGNTPYSNNFSSTLYKDFETASEQYGEIGINSGGRGSVALNVTMTNTSPAPAATPAPTPANCEAEAYVIASDRLYWRKTGLTAGGGTQTFNNIALLGRDGFSQNNLLVAGTVAKQSVAPPAAPTSSDKDCYIYNYDMTATDPLIPANTYSTNSSKKFAKIECTDAGTAYNLSYTNKDAFDNSAVSVIFMSAGEGIKCGPTCVNPNQTVTCNGVKISPTEGGMSTQLLWKPSCP